MFNLMELGKALLKQLYQRTVGIKVIIEKDSGVSYEFFEIWAHQIRRWFGCRKQSRPTQYRQLVQFVFAGQNDSLSELAGHRSDNTRQKTLAALLKNWLSNPLLRQAV